MSLRPLAIALACALAARFALDFATNVPVGGFNLAQVGTGALLVGAWGATGWLAARRAAALQGVLGVLGPWLGLVVLTLGVAAVRADDPMQALERGVEIGGPLGLLLLAASLPRPHDRAAAAAGLVAGALVPPTALLVSAPLADSWQLLHGLDRLVGPYANLHTAGLAAATATLALAIAVDGLRGRARWAATLGATVGAATLAMTHVRTGALFAAVALALFWALERRWMRVGALAGALALALAVSPTLRGRYADVVEVVAETPGTPAHERLGSHRLALWRQTGDVLATQPLADTALGRGLGDHRVTRKGLDPHSDVLSMVLEAGPLGALGWLGTLVALPVAWLRRGRPQPETPMDRVLLHAALAVVPAALLALAISNAHWTRPSHALALWAVVGLGWGALPRVGPRI